MHAITNWVTGGDVANALQALGARPVLAVSAEELAEITASGGRAATSTWGPRPPTGSKPWSGRGRRANEMGQPRDPRPGGAGASHLREEACRKIRRNCA